MHSNLNNVLQCLAVCCSVLQRVAVSSRTSALESYGIVIWRAI